MQNRIVKYMLSVHIKESKEKILEKHIQQLEVRVLKSKYEFRMVYRSSSLWPEIKQFYSTIFDYTSWTIGTCSFINF